MLIAALMVVVELEDQVKVLWMLEYNPLSFGNMSFTLADDLLYELCVIFADAHLHFSGAFFSSH